MSLCTEGLCRTVECTQGGWWWYYPHGQVFRDNNIHYSLKSPHMVLSILCPGCKITRHYSWTNQVGTPLMCRYLSWSLAILCRISSSGYKSINWSCLTSISYGVWWWFFHSSIHEGSHNTPKLDRSFATQIIKWCTREYWPWGYLVQSRSWGISQRNPNLLAKRGSRECHVISVLTTRTRRSVQKGSVCLWSDRTSSFWGGSTQLKFKVSFFC